MENEIKKLSSNVFHKIYLWATESTPRSLLIIIIFFIFGIPLVSYLQQLVKDFPYIPFFNAIIWFLSGKISFKEYIFLLLLLLLLFWLIHLSREIKKTYLIEENFTEVNLNKWSIPIGSGWTVSGCENAPGNMLSVTNSTYPGTLKGGYGWYDYEFSFLAKIDKDLDQKYKNFSVAVRSENNLNGIMLQITTTHLHPHLLYNGSYIKDTESDIQLPTVLKPDIWYKVKIKVIGNNIDISIDNYKITYKIPTKVLNSVETRLLSMTSTLKELEDSNRDIEIKQTEAYESFKKAIEKPRGVERDTAMSEVNKKYNEIPPSNKVVLEFQKGSVGFRESGSEHAYFRNVLVRKCE